MVFSSLTFLCIFFPVVFIAYQFLPGIRSKNALLVVVSLIFYAYGEPVYVVLMILSSLVNWGLGLLVGQSTQGAQQGRKKLYLAVAIVANLIFLGVFKYAGMAVGSVNYVFGLNLNIPLIELPIGISFYTFQAMSYVIDVYRGEVKPQKSYSRVLLYISFFPQLIAGPIVKYHDIEEQLTKRHATLDDKTAGFIRFCIGLAKKVLIANTMASVVDSLYAASPDQVNICVAWVAALAYIMQIYFDFSGYSDMAIGMARMFGFHYKENFNYPYTSQTVQVFWRRWHISLSTWFKDYLYIPLGGNRKGRPRAVLNKIIVFFTCGLWHGASWTFVLWGLGHGFFLLLEEYLPIRKLPKALGVIYALLVVTVLFVLFRADTIEQAGLFISQMFTGFHFEYASMSLLGEQLTPLFIFMFACACVAATPFAKNLLDKTRLRAEEKASLGDSKSLICVQAVQCVGALVLLLVCILSLSGGGYNPFIYFRF